MYIYVCVCVFFSNKMSETFRNYNKICCHGGDHSEYSNLYDHPDLPIKMGHLTD